MKCQFRGGGVCFKDAAPASVYCTGHKHGRLRFILVLILLLLLSTPILLGDRLIAQNDTEITPYQMQPDLVVSVTKFTEDSVSMHALKVMTPELQTVCLVPFEHYVGHLQEQKNSERLGLVKHENSDLYVTSYMYALGDLAEQISYQWSFMNYARSERGFHMKLPFGNSWHIYAIADEQWKAVTYDLHGYKSYEVYSTSFYGAVGTAMYHHADKYTKKFFADQIRSTPVVNLPMPANFYGDPHSSEEK